MNQTQKEIIIGYIEDSIINERGARESFIEQIDSLYNISEWDFVESHKKLEEKISLLLELFIKS